MLSLRRSVLVVLASAALLPACSEKKEATPPPPADQKPAAQTESKPAEPAVARAGDAHVTVDAFERRKKQYGPAFQSTPQSNRFLAETMLDEEILMGEAEKRGLDKDADIASRLESYRRQLLLGALLDKLAPAPESFTDEQVKEFFEKNSALYKQPERIRVSRIAFAPTDKEKAKEVLAKAKKGADFAQLARDYSLDKGSAQLGGDIGYYVKGSRPDIGDGPFELKKPGDVGLFETPLQVNVVKLVERLPPHEEKLEDPKTKEAVRRQLRAQLLEAERRKILDERKKATPPTFDDAALAKEAAAPTPPPTPPSSQQPQK